MKSSRLAWVKTDSGGSHDGQDAKALYEAAVKEFGKVDILVNNAWPGFTPGSVTDIEWDQFQNYTDVMVKGAFQVTKAASPSWNIYLTKWSTRQPDMWA